MNLKILKICYLYTLSLLASTLFISNAYADVSSCSIVTAPAASLESATMQFEQSCPGLQRQDCDPVSDNRWMCSTSSITADTPVQASLEQPLPDTVKDVDSELDEDALTPEVTSDDTGQTCEATGPDLRAAISAYAANCPDIPRKDCDPTDDGQWVCSSETMGASAPDIVTGNPTTQPEPSNPVSPPSEPVPTQPVLSEPTPADPTPSTEPPTTPVNNPSSEQVDHTYAKNDGPFKNPLKGWNSGWDGDNDHPESSVGFQYIPWRDFEPSDGNFDFAAVEDRLDNAGSKNRHVIIRLYCDWHGNDAESDCPGWIYTDAGVARLRGDNGRYITDFNDSRYIAQAQEAIRALARGYDNDPRLYAVQMGVIGYWGEWHTFGSSFNGNSYNLTDETRSIILNAYKNNFSKGKIMARYPWREPTQSASGIGFHNDFFVANNGHSEEFDDSVAGGSQWINNPIGGEVPPRGGSEASSERNTLFNSPSGMAILENGHYSTMKAGAYRVTRGQSGYEGYMRMHKKMGYNYQIDLARFPDSVNATEQISVELIGTNIGVAPMYFDWEVQFALLDQRDQPVVTQTSNSDLMSILPGAMFNFTGDMTLRNLKPGTYRMAVRIMQPGADKAKQTAWKLDARNTYILFANDIPVVDGKWTANKLLGGWSVLGNVTVK